MRLSLIFTSRKLFRQRIRNPPEENPSGGWLTYQKDRFLISLSLSSPEPPILFPINYPAQICHSQRQSINCTIACCYTFEADLPAGISKAFFSPHVVLAYTQPSFTHEKNRALFGIDFCGCWVLCLDSGPPQGEWPISSYHWVIMSSPPSSDWFPYLPEWNTIIITENMVGDVRNWGQDPTIASMSVI